MKHYELLEKPKSLEIQFVYNLNKLSDYYLGKEYSKIMKKIAPEAMFSWYSKSKYEGFGWALIIKDKGWYMHDMQHCSCFGPLDKLDLTVPMAKTLKELENCVCDDIKEKIQPLIDLAKEKGY